MRFINAAANRPILEVQKTIRDLQPLARLILVSMAILGSPIASAQIRIGVTVSSTGPAAALGIPEKNTVDLFPRMIAGKTVEYIVLDDASDTTAAVTNVRKLISEQKVDAIIGSTTTPNCLAILPAVGEGKTPTIALASASRITEPMDENRAWMFRTPQSDTMMATAIAENMSNAGVKTLGYIGFSNALGETFFTEVSKFAELKRITVVSNERFAPTDASVTGQVLRLVASNPDAIVIGASGSPAATPVRALIERGYKGRIYHSHGTSTREFLRVCGKDCDGTFLATVPVIVASQLLDSNPVKKPALVFQRLYDAKFGPNSVSAFSSYAWDAYLRLEAAIPVALKTSQPGTPAFRAALRDALEKISDLATTNGVVNMGRNDHLGLDQRARVMVTIKNEDWRILPQY